MLKLRDFLHLPQVDELVNRLVSDEEGMIVLAGIDARPQVNGNVRSITPSGLSALFNILMQEILMTRPLAYGIIVTQEKVLGKVPRQIQRRVRSMLVDSTTSYQQQIDLAAGLRPGLLVIDRLDASSAPAAFRAAQAGIRVLAQFDTILRGAAVARQFLDLGVARDQLTALHWILTTQRISVLCGKCKHEIEPGTEPFDRLIARYPRLQPVLDRLLRPQDIRERPHFYRAGSCETCHGTGYSGDIALFDIFCQDHTQGDLFTQPALLSLEEYALHLAAQGELDLTDLLDLEADHLRRTYQMLTASERALTQANTELYRKLFELEASNRVLVQRTEALMSLQDLGQALISSTGLSDLAARISRRAGEMCGADRVALYLRRVEAEGDESAQILAVRGWDTAQVGARVDWRLISDRNEPKRTIRFTQLPPGLNLAQPAEKQTIQTGLRVPLIVQDQPVGVMLIQSTQKGAFTPGEIALLNTFANQAALAIQRAGLVEELEAKIAQLEAAQAELVQKERIERELELARDVQQSMLPHSFPDLPGYAISAHYVPARQVGGDFYDVFWRDNDHFGIVIADVADKGMPAALYMALTRSLLLAEARRALSPRDVLLNVNQLLLDLSEMGGFVSIFYGVVNYASRRLTYARAGHERPLLLRNDESLLLCGEGAVLGILAGEDLHLSEEWIDLRPDDRLILYTDGLTDVADAHGDFSGLARLRALLERISHRSALEVCQAIFAELDQYRGQAEQFDDMTLLVLEVT
jgi:sigma-B regulation protein RsbU (phosphoserine phosphatase)